MAQCKINLKKLPVVFLTMIIIATAFVITGCGKTVINVEESKILKVKVSGLDGTGKIEVSVNEDRLDKLKEQYREEENYSEINKLLNSIEFELEDESVNGTLSKGDTVNIVVKYDEDIAEEGKISLKKEVIRYKIKAGKLKRGTEIDAFKGFKLTYIGNEGEVYAYENTSGCDEIVKEADIYFTVEAENNGFLKNGDKITVTADSHKNLEEEGYFLKEKSKEFVVLGLEAARKTLEGVDFSAIAAQMLYEVNAYTENDFDLVCFLDCKFESGKDRELDTKSFNFTKQLDFLNYAYSYDPSDYRNKNCFIAFYKLTVDIDCINDQYSGSNSDPDLMKKGEKDTGVCYIAVKTYSAVKVSKDNKLVTPNMIYTMIDAPTMEDCIKALEIDSYTTEYFDANYKKLDTSATDSVTESAIKATSEAVTEATTYAVT